MVKVTMTSEVSSSNFWSILEETVPLSKLIHKGYNRSFHSNMIGLDGRYWEDRNDPKKFFGQTSRNYVWPTERSETETETFLTPRPTSIFWWNIRSCIYFWILYFYLPISTILACNLFWQISVIFTPILFSVIIMFLLQADHSLVSFKSVS